MKQTALILCMVWLGALPCHATTTGETGSISRPRPILQLADIPGNLSAGGPSSMTIMNADGIRQASRSNTIRIDGDLYIDYSALTTRSGFFEVGKGQYLSLRSDLEIYMDAGTLPGHYATIEIETQPLDLTLSGNYLVCAGTPVISSNFDVTGNIYIGHYAQTPEVPLPASLVTLASGMAVLLVTCICRRTVSG